MKTPLIHALVVLAVVSMTQTLFAAERAPDARDASAAPSMVMNKPEVRKVSAEDVKPQPDLQARSDAAVPRPAVTQTLKRVTVYNVGV